MNVTGWQVVSNKEVWQRRARERRGLENGRGGCVEGRGSRDAEKQAEEHRLFNKALGRKGVSSVVLEREKKGAWRDSGTPLMMWEGRKGIG